LLVHGDVAGIENTRRALSDWLDWMGLVGAGAHARIDRYVGYYEPYATSHESLDRDAPPLDGGRECGSRGGASRGRCGRVR
jgi:hypothetical protein